MSGEVWDGISVISLPSRRAGKGENVGPGSGAWPSQQKNGLHLIQI